ncbi:MAG: hypothetical protein ABSG51_10785 [Terracidiphilus sp.]|jgi:hypothetical protein
MFCSGCGQALIPAQPVCPNCGRPAAQVIPPIPGLQFQVENYAGKIRALSIVWFFYAGYTLLRGIVGVTVLGPFFAQHFGNWEHGPWSHGSLPDWFGPAFLHLMWVSILGRTAIALVTAWGLMERTRWARIFAIVVAILSLIRFPFGTALGIWTLVVLLGFQNHMLYQQVEQH